MESKFVQYLGEEFWDLYLGGFRPSSYSDYEYELQDNDYSEAKRVVGANKESTPKLRRDRTKNIQMLQKLHFNQRNNTDSETDYEGTINRFC